MSEVKRYCEIIFFNFSIIIFFASCNNNQPEFAGPPAKPQSVDRESLLSCFDRTDTIFDNLNSIRYVILDSSFSLKIKIGGVDTLMGYRFNCSTPRVLVPGFYSSSQNMICLKRGYGQHFREFIILYNDHDQIFIKTYETALATDLKNDLVVYRDYDSLHHVIAERIRGGSKNVFIIPEKFRKTTEIPEAEIVRGKLRIKYSSGQISYSLK
jgi:hypothetical protein